MLQVAGFCSLVEEGSFLGASKSLNTQASNVRLQVGSLERFLGFELFKRIKGKIILTPEGERVYRSSKYLLTGFENLYSNTLNSVTNGVDDHIRIAAHPFALSHLVPDVLKKIKKQVPLLTAALHNVERIQSLDVLMRGEVDFIIAVSGSFDLPEGFERVVFYRCCFALGMSISHPLSKIKDDLVCWNEIAKYSFVTVGNKITAKGLTDIIRRYKIYSDYDLQNGTWEICLGLIKSGLALSGADVKYFKDVSGITFKRCPHLLPDYGFDLIFNRNSIMSTAAKAFLSHCQNRMV